MTVAIHTADCVIVGPCVIPIMLYHINAAGDELLAIIVDLGNCCRKDHCKGKDCLGKVGRVCKENHSMKQEEG